VKSWGTFVFLAKASNVLFFTALDILPNDELRTMLSTLGSLK
jgi:hypothetical protein